MKFLLLINLFIGALYAEEQPALSRNTGFALLKNFTCDSMGNRTRDVLGSVQNLYSLIETLQKDIKECSSLSNSIAALPEVRSIISAFNADAESQALKEQEKLITEALADISFLQGIPEGDPRRELYPTVAVLNGVVRNARAELMRLRARIAVRDSQASRERFNQGIVQLNQLADGLNTILASDNECMQKAPQLKQHVTAGLVGIAGFFLDSPLGMGVALGGKILQNLFSMRRSSKIKNKSELYQPTDQAVLAAGLQCAMEFQSKQHCRMLREKQLFSSQQNQNKSNSVLQSVDQQRDLMKAVEEIQNWSSAVDAFAQQSDVNASRADMKSAFINAKDSVNRELNKVRQGLQAFSPEARPRAQREQVFNALPYFSQIFGGGGGGGGGGGNMGGASYLQNLFPEEERRAEFLNLLFDREEAQKLNRELQQEIDKRYPQEASRYITMPANYKFTTLKSLTDVPAIQRINARLEEKDIIEQIQTKIRDYEKRVTQQVSTELSDEKVSAAMDYFVHGNAIGVPSPYENLKFIQDTIRNVPPEFRDRFGHLLNLDGMSGEIQKVVEGVEKSQKNGFREKTEMLEVIGKMNDVIGRDNQLYRQVRTFSDRFTSYQYEQLKSTAGINPEVVSETLFLMNRDILTDAMNFVSVPTSKNLDYDTALGISASQIESFTDYFDDYFPTALNYLNGLDVDGKRLSEGVRTNISTNLKSNFCIQALGLTTVPQNVVSQCQGSSLRIGSNVIEFSKLYQKDHKERVCAYQNARRKEAVSTDNRRSSTAPASR